LWKGWAHRKHRGRIENGFFIFFPGLLLFGLLQSFCALFRSQDAAVYTQDELDEIEDAVSRQSSVEG
jgi:hypothetical protein